MRKDLEHREKTVRYYLVEASNGRTYVHSTFSNLTELLEEIANSQTILVHYQNQLQSYVTLLTKHVVTLKEFNGEM